MYMTRSLGEYLDDLAAKKPAPGGGSAAALTGAIAAGLLSMVANFTIGKERYKQVEEDVRRLLGSSERIRKGLSALVDEDVKVYQNVSEAFATKDPKKKEEALKEASIVPVNICKFAYEGVHIASELAEKGNANLITDVGVAAELFGAAFIGAELNVSVNLRGISDKEFIKATRLILDPMERDIPEVKNKIMETVKGKLR